MALGHGPQILNDFNTAKLASKPTEGFVDDLGKHIRYQWYVIGEQILDNPVGGYAPEKEMLEEGYKYQRSAVESYRKGVLSGISPKDIDLAIQKIEIPKESLDRLKNAVADLTSGKYPLSDLKDWMPLAGKALKVLPVVGSIAGLSIADSLANDAVASNMQGFRSLGAGDENLGLQHLADGAINQLRSDVKRGEVVLNLVPGVSLIVGLAISPVLEAVDKGLYNLTTEGRMIKAKNAQMAQAFSYLIHNADQATSQSYLSYLKEIDHRPDIKYAVEAVEKIRIAIDIEDGKEVKDLRQSFTGVLSSIEENLMDLIASGEVIRIVEPQYTKG